MRTAILLIFVSLSCYGQTFIQANTCSHSGDPATCSASPAASNLLIACAMTYGTGTISSITDNKSDTWTTIWSGTYAGSHDEMCARLSNVPSGITSIIAHGPATGLIGVVWAEFSGYDTSSPIGTTATPVVSTPNGSTILATPSLSLTVPPNKILFGLVWDGNGGITYTPPAGWTQRAQITSIEFTLFTAPVSTNASYTLNGTTMSSSLQPRVGLIAVNGPPPPHGRVVIVTGR